MIFAALVRQGERRGLVMPFIKESFLFRLFRQKEERDKAKQEQQPAEQAEPAASAEPAAQLPEEKEPEQRPALVVDLPKDHSLYKLWNIYSEQTGWQPEPSLVMADDDGTIFEEKEGQAELVRLRIAINSSAKTRVERIRVAQKTEGKPEEGKEAPPPPLPDFDAEPRVFITKSGTSAWVLVYPPVGNGRELDDSLLRQALDAQNVSFGLQDEALKALPKAGDRYFRLILAAKGQRPVNGDDGYVEDEFPRTQERKLKVDEHNHVDYMNIDFIHNVAEGGVICHIFDPTDGTPGRTVQDKAIPAKKGKSPDIPKGTNTKVSEDGKSLVATMAGHVEFSGRDFQVKPVLTIPGNVDFSVGNIDFVGDVRIRGDVCSGFTVKASGTINVDGVVEASTIEAGKDLILAKGVQGNGQAVIRAQRNVFAKYLENSSIYARVNLETECLINCEVYCGGGVSVKSGHKSIIGGKVSAGHEVNAGVVGSRVGNQTEIMLGGSPCDAFDYEELDREIEELEQLIVRTERQPDSPDKAGRLLKLQIQLAESRQKLQAAHEERREQELENGIEEQPSTICRFRTDTVYPGTILTMGDQIHRFTEKLSPCHASLLEGEIHFNIT